MINILFFIERLSFNGSIGGAEKVLSTLVNHMDTKKFNITIQTVFPDKAEHMINKNIKFKPMYKKQNKFTTLLYRIETALGLTYRLHLRGDYDIEAAYLEFGPTKVMGKSTNKKAKKLAWVHCDLDTAIKDKDSFKAKSGQYYKNYDYVMCVSEKTKDSFLDIFGNEYQAKVLHNVIDDTEIQDKAKLNWSGNVCKNRFTLLTIGRFFPQKNYMRLLKAVNRLKDDGYDFDLWVVGDGVDRPMIEEYITIHHLSDTVTLWGFQKNPYPFIREADLLVCSSNYEGYSTFITEGIILKKPIITTDCSGMHELLGDSEYGIIVGNDDEAFYQGLKDLLSNKDTEIPRLQEKVSKRSGDFKLEKLVKDTEQFFIDLLNE